MAIGGFVLRSGLVIGTVYYTRYLGVWGNSQQTERLYHDIKNGIRPQLQQLEHSLPFQVPALPPKGEVRYLMKHYYNEGVKGTFHFITMLPCYTGQAMKKTKDTLTELLDNALTPAQPPAAKIEECKPEPTKKK